jgi:hypothetical protein
MLNRPVDSWQFVLNHTIAFYMLDSFTERVKQNRKLQIITFANSPWEFWGTGILNLFLALGREVRKHPSRFH